MRINFMIALIVLTFSTVVGILGLDYYTRLTMVNQGLQECIIKTDTTLTVIWSKECDK